MPHTLPTLTYPYPALEPYFDAATMELHHTKHHQTYVDKLNAALDKFPDLQAKPVEALLQDLSSLPETIRPAVKNHGGGHANHSFFWLSLTPPIATQISNPTGTIAEAINRTFGSFASFQTKFAETALGHFGSGWAWLTIAPSELSPKPVEGVEGSRLKIYSLPNQDSPLSQHQTPLLALDVWEHAYYLKYQNRRADYIAAFWHLVNWSEIEKRYQEIIK